MTEVFGLTIAERLEASNDSNYNRGTPSNSILVFQSSESCLASSLAHHNYFAPPNPLSPMKDSQNNKGLESNQNQFPITKPYNSRTLQGNENLLQSKNESEKDVIEVGFS